jgi:hypothetical protein
MRGARRQPDKSPIVFNGDIECRPLTYDIG